jgi:probable metal-binding protein
MTSIHGHEVLHMMLEQAAGFASVEALVAAIETRFGPRARFHTCSAEDMDARQLVQFLTERGKFVPRDGGFNTSPEKICSH